MSVMVTGGTGFIGNRMQFALLREAISIVESGIASTEDVDLVVKSSCGRRLSVAGPFEGFDLAGVSSSRPCGVAMEMATGTEPYPAG